jgi:hypothetical protein
MQYGFGAPMQADLSPYLQDGFIRLNFLGLTKNPNFSIQLFRGTAYAQGGRNINYYRGPFSVELPLLKFVDNELHFVDITSINFILHYLFQFVACVVPAVAGPHDGCIRLRSTRIGKGRDFETSNELRPEQRRAVEAVLDSRDLAINVREAAGTGKTAILREIDLGLREARHEVLAVSPTRRKTKLRGLSDFNGRTKLWRGFASG